MSRKAIQVFLSQLLSSHERTTSFGSTDRIAVQAEANKYTEWFRPSFLAGQVISLLSSQRTTPALDSTDRFPVLRDGDSSSKWMRLNMLSSGILVNNTITNAMMADNAIDTAELVDGAVTNAKLATNSVGEAKIIDSSVSSAKIADGAVDSAELATECVTAVKVAPAGVIETTNSTTTTDYTIGTSATTLRSVSYSPDANGLDCDLLIIGDAAVYGNTASGLSNIRMQLVVGGSTIVDKQVCGTDSGSVWGHGPVVCLSRRTSSSSVTITFSAYKTNFSGTCTAYDPQLWVVELKKVA